MKIYSYVHFLLLIMKLYDYLHNPVKDFQDTVYNLVRNLLNI